jgi:hypothetical protein
MVLLAGICCGAAGTVDAVATGSAPLAARPPAPISDPPPTIVKLAQARAKRHKRRRAGARLRPAKSTRHNFYDAEINGARGRRRKPGAPPTLLYRWCLDCFGGGR